MTNANDPTEDMIREEIRKAVEILKSDGIHIHKTYAAFQKTLTGGPEKQTDKETDKETEKETGKNKGTEGGPPPVKDPETAPPAVKSGLWWGTKLHDAG